MSTSLWTLCDIIGHQLMFYQACGYRVLAERLQTARYIKEVLLLISLLILNFFFIL